MSPPLSLPVSRRKSQQSFSGGGQARGGVDYLRVVQTGEPGAAGESLDGYVAYPGANQRTVAHAAIPLDENGGCQVRESAFAGRAHRSEEAPEDLPEQIQLW